MTLFTDLGLKPEILRAIDERGYKEPTPIQELAIPYVLMGRDVLGCAQTGTGKTASFCLPMLEILCSGRAKARMPRSLILEPTRELAAQVDENFAIYGKYTGMTTALLTGGQGMEDQIKKLDKGFDVLIATPGRLIDHFERGRILLQDIKIFVIDEADRMLDMGFIPDIEKIAGMLPKLRQTLFFSATMAPEIRKLADNFLMNPREVSVAPPASTAATVEQAFISVNNMGKRGALREILRQQGFKSAFIFCNRKRDVGTLVESLQRHGFAAAGLHGDMAQTARNEALDKFKKNEITLLVCSDVAARGLDVKNVDAVFNFDVPFNAEDYVHRIGRTGRAGSSGQSFTFVTADDDKLWGNVLALIKTEVKEIKLEGVSATPENPVQAAAEHYRHSHPKKSGPRDRRRSGNDRGSHKSRPPRYEERSAESNEPLAQQKVVGFGEDLPAFLGNVRRRANAPTDTEKTSQAV